MSVKNETFVDGQLRQCWDLEKQTYTAYDETGSVVEDRPLTGEELAAMQLQYQEAATPAGQPTDQAPVAPALDSGDVAAIQADIAKASTVAELKAALTDLLARLT
jgi:hypothetical protein